MGPRKHLLNEHTSTLHKPQEDTTTNETVCGALRHVPQGHVTSIADDEMEEGHGLERCGRCFDGAGGY